MTIRPRGFRAIEILLYFTLGCASVGFVAYYQYLTEASKRELLLFGALFAFVLYCWAGIIRSHATLSENAIKLRVVRLHTVSYEDLVYVGIWNSGKDSSGVPSLIIKSERKTIYFPISLYRNEDVKKLIHFLKKNVPDIKIDEELNRWLKGKVAEPFNKFRLIAGGGALGFFAVTLTMILTA